MFDQATQRRWLARLLLSFAAGATVSGLAYICAWQEYRNFDNFLFAQRATQQSLKRIEMAIRDHQKATGKLPPTLRELHSLKDGPVRLDDDGRPLDGWQRPIHYRVENGSFKLFSLGRDGEAGGDGLDADLHYDQPDAPNASPTLWQFYFDLDTQGILTTCLFAGAIAFFLCFLSAWSVNWPGANTAWMKMVFELFVTLLFAIFMAVIMSALHLPSGH